MKASIICIAALCTLQVLAVPAPLNCVPGQYVKKLFSGAVCASCLPRYFSTANNAPRCTAFSQCMPGTYVHAAGSSTSDVDCRPCSSGTFSTWINAGACVNHRICSARKYEARAPSATNDRLCFNCPGGVCTTTTTTTTTATTTTATTTTITTTMYSYVASTSGEAIFDAGLLLNFDFSVDLGNTPITSMRVKFSILHNWDEDVFMHLRAPNGNVLKLFADIGGNLQNFENTVISSTATTAITSDDWPFTGTYLPRATGQLLRQTEDQQELIPNVTTFSDLYSVPNGVWTIQVGDDVTFAEGSVTSLSIEFNF